MRLSLKITLGTVLLAAAALVLAYLYLPVNRVAITSERENLDLKEQNFAPEAMQEFIRDTIANINGIYYVMSINPDLLSNIWDQQAKGSAIAGHL
jgi:hypothetical protein